MATLLIADDDDITRESLSTVLTMRGFLCFQARNGREALQKIEKQTFDVVISDLEMPEMGGMELLEKASQLQPRLSFIIITAFASVESAIEALRRGAYDYLLKPLNFEDVAHKIEKLIEHRALILENQALRQVINSQYDFSNIIGKSAAIRRVFETIKKVADSDSNVLITGNSGTGKELVAKAIHYNSRRQRGGFVAVNCGAIAETLFESEMFGHKRGSFTGAVADKDGLFKIARDGTLFLDEIGELSLSSQAKLLRAIESREILPVGSTQPFKVDIRILAATNCELLSQIQRNNFREDLYYRLNVIEIHLPSLSERREDIPLLVNHFIRRYNNQMNRKIKGVEPQLLNFLINRSWKGEVRELENFIERMMIFASGDMLTLADLPKDMEVRADLSGVMTGGSNLRSAVREFERFYIREQLQQHHFHRGKTARALGIGEATLYRKLAELGIDSETTT